MNHFESAIVGYFGEEKFKKIQSVRIGIVGAGGLGSNCAHNLVRVGFKKFVIVDFDVVEESNLGRQFYFFDQVAMKKVHALHNNLKKINHDIETEVHIEKIVPGNIFNLFKDCDVIVEAFDKADEKKMLVTEFLPTGKFIVSVSGLAGIGHSDDIKIHYIKENLVVIGDLKSEVGKETPPLSPRVNVAAAKQADVVLEYVVNKYQLAKP